jgi:hypothetical protein
MSNSASVDLQALFFLLTVQFSHGRGGGLQTGQKYLSKNLWGKEGRGVTFVTIRYCNLIGPAKQVVLRIIYMYISYMYDTYKISIQHS